MTEIGPPTQIAAATQVVGATASTLMRAALELADEGFRVFPCHTASGDGCSCDRDCSSPGKHPRTANGCKDATRDRTAIETWWRSWPDANVGVATGDGLLVVDLDGTEAQATIEAIAADHGGLPRTRAVRTGREGGRHLWFRAGDADAGLRNTSGRIGKNIDTRAAGGYVLAPPSVHASGRAYTWEQPGTPLAPLPAWIVDRLTDLPRPTANGAAPAALDERRVNALGDVVFASELDALAAHSREAGTGRGTALFASSAKLGRIIGAGGLDLSSAWQALIIAGQRMGLPEAEVDRNIERGLEKGMSQPLELAERPLKKQPAAAPASTDNGSAEKAESIEPREPAKQAGSETDRPAGTNSLTPEEEEVPDATHFFEEGKFIAPRLSGWLRIRFPTATGGRRLYAFVDGTYAPAETFMRSTITRILGPQWTRNRAEEVVAHLMQSSEPLWEAPPRDRIAVTNGLLSLSTRDLLPANAEFRSPVRIGGAYDPNARCPAIERFMQEVFPEGAQLLYEVVGHLMVPENRQRAFMFLGPGGNGKSTVLRLIKQFLGGENVSSVSLHALEDNRFATADLYGKLANIYADLDARELNATGIFKSITGGDPIRGEHKHRDAFSFIAYARLVFSANEAPPTHDSSQAFFDRWIIVPFQQRIRGAAHERQQDDLLAELTKPHELAGLLNHALDGLDRLRQTGRFSSTESTTRAGHEFRSSADSVAAFLSERCTTEPQAREPRGAIWNGYRDWCHGNNRRAVGAQRFHGRVRELVDVDELTVNGTRMYVGIRLETSE